MSQYPHRQGAAPGAAFLCRPTALWLLAAAAAVGGCQPVESTAPTASALGAPANIGALQGENARSAYEGETVTVQGVITGNFVSGLGGFFMQDADGAADNNPRTSNAVFVEWGPRQQPKVRRGDRVRVSGQVVERGEIPFTLTALAKPTVEVLGRGAVVASVVAEAPAHVRDWEALEGMWLRFEAALTLADHPNLYRHGELIVALGERPRAPTDRHPPGPKARALADEQARRLLVLDDNRQGQGDKLPWYLAEPPAAAAPLRSGSRLLGVEGILDSRFGGWRLQLTEKLGSIEQAPRPPPPVLPEGLRLGSFNLHNLFNGNGRGQGFPTPRGASEKKLYERQLNKLVAALATLQPDVAALSEVENDGHEPRPALADLVDALNRALGDAGDYRAVDSGRVDDGAIRVALIYRSQRVSPVGTPASLSDGAFQRGNRPPLAQTFSTDAGFQVTVVAVHFKSKGSCQEVADDDPANRDQSDGQGCWNALRVEAARELDRWLQANPTASGSPHTVLLGDFNAYRQEDPLRLLRSQGWRSAAARNNDGDHSFVFNGLRGSLDHALLSPSAVPLLRGFGHWSINSDENEHFDYRRDGSEPPTPFASSDHDPLLLVLDRSGPAP